MTHIHARHSDVIGTESALLAARQGKETLRLPSGTRITRAHDDLEKAAAESVRLLRWSGVALPCVWLADALVVPIVRWNEHGWRTRRARNVGPIVDRAWWLASADASYGDAPDAPLDIRGFLVLGALHRSRAALGRLRTTAPVAALIPSLPAPDALELIRCDYYGYSVVAATDTKVELVLNAGTWEPPDGQVHFQRKLREEQLFEVALRSGQAPISL
ncbi:hypothetical protein DDP54_07825 [Cellulomonas sp. WB94]|jgi:hypothetical protein|uniref:hypothetical protein n=1 Tax=Cellulomonas sp. WB94 TaxID=2173174 RepID=UPI000D566342|nr:hypothetical protein [Cellulomonas sp. WB94]PVU82928.1 hypothetical protein DDP54_07825 [Cellulomonas sp. WB94]